MIKISTLLVALLAGLMMVTFPVGCGSDDDGDDDNDDNDSSDDDDDDDDATAATLDENHSGWEKPGCFEECHSEDENKPPEPPHDLEKLTPPDCAECHGTNGAKAMPSDHVEEPENCECHMEEEGFTEIHLPEEQFPDDTEKCYKCHVQE